MLEDTFSLMRANISAYVDPEDPHLSLYDVDDESTVITLADWYHPVRPCS